MTQLLWMTLLPKTNSLDPWKHRQSFWPNQDKYIGPSLR